MKEDLSQFLLIEFSVPPPQWMLQNEPKQISQKCPLNKTSHDLVIRMLPNVKPWGWYVQNNWH